MVDVAEWSSADSGGTVAEATRHREARFLMWWRGGATEDDVGMAVVSGGKESLGGAHGMDVVRGHLMPPGAQTKGQPRVCVLTSSFPDGADDSGGVFVREQVRRLSLSTFTDVVYPSRRASSMYRDEPFLRRRTRYPFRSPAMSQVRGIEYVRTLEVCTALALGTRSRRGYDLYHAYWAIPSGFVARCVKGHRPLVITLCGSDINTFASKPGFRESVRWALAGATRVIAVSHELLDRAVDLGVDPSRGTVIPSGVDTEAFVPLVHKTWARRALGLPDSFLCVYVGSLFRSKRVDRIVRAIARVGKQNPCALAIVGDGPERSSLEMVAAECGCDVRFLGNRPHGEVARIVSCCDSFVMASTLEGLPTSVQEAMSCGVPVIAIDAGGLREIVVDSVTGFLVRDETGMSRMIRHLAEHRDVAANLGAQAREFACAELSVETCVERTLTVYDLCLRTAQTREPISSTSCSGRSARRANVRALTR